MCRINRVRERGKTDEHRISTCVHHRPEAGPTDQSPEKSKAEKIF